MTSMIVFGATSAIAERVARLYAAEGARLCLVARDAAKLRLVADDLRGRGAREVVEHVFDFGAVDRIPALVGALIGAFGLPDRALIAYGSLPDQAACTADETAARAALDLTFTGPALLLQALARAMMPGGGAIGVIGSVAGDRGRASNYVYGAAKGGLGLFAQGLAHRLARPSPSSPPGAARLSIVLIKPGFVDTPMTAAFPKGPLWAKPEAVAEDIRKALEKGGSAVIYTPFFWRFIMLAIRLLPQPVMHRTGL